MASLGQTLKRLREEAGWSQQEFADKMSVRSGKQTVSRWELGKAEPSLTELRRIAELYNISLAMLFSDENLAGNRASEPAPGYIVVPAEEYVELQRRVIRLQDEQKKD